jgi:hypothetical protein
MTLEYGKFTNCDTKNQSAKFYIFNSFISVRLTLVQTRIRV